MFKSLPALLVLFAIAGCATTGAPARLFLLGQDVSAPPPPALVENAPNVVLAPVKVAGFLDKSGIVYQTGANEVSVAARNLWAQPLPEQLQRALYTELAGQLQGVSLFPDLRAAPARSVRLVLEFSGFHGRYDGQALVAGTWSLTDAQNQPLLRQPFAYEVALENDGYTELVRALGAGLAAAARDIATSVNRYALPGNSANPE